MLKNLLICALALVLTLTLFTACGEEKPPVDGTGDQSTDTKEPAQSEAVISRHLLADKYDPRVNGIYPVAGTFTDRLDAFEMLGVYFKLIPSVLLVSAFCFAVYEFSTNTVSAVLFQFIFTVLIGYASGCIFPVWFFPEVLQKIAPFTPIGAARGYFAACFTGEDFGLYLALCLGFAALLFGLALLRRRQRILGKSEVAVW